MKRCRLPILNSRLYAARSTHTLIDLYSFMALILRRRSRLVKLRTVFAPVALRIETLDCKHSERIDRKINRDVTNSSCLIIARRRA